MTTSVDSSNVVQIPLANGCRVYDCDEIYRLYEEATAEQLDLKKLYHKMIENGSERFLMKPSKLPSMKYLEDQLPNFIEPLREVERQLALCLNSGDPIEISPFLLLGPPGIGKTHFAQQLAGILETESKFISMSTTTAGWLLSGSSSQWRGARPGKVFQAIVDDMYANPVIIVDEIDKAGQSTLYDPLGSLYSLLEKDTAKKFVDEYAEVAIDASHIIWVATANDVDSIPKPIQSRLNIHEIQPPSKEQSRAIALSLYRSIKESHKWGSNFDEYPPEDVLDIFSTRSPRDMKGSWMTTFGNAKLCNRGTVLPQDIPQPKQQKRSIGF